MYKRSNVIKEFILNTFTVISSYPRLLLEVFLRRNMGERYFSLAGVVIITLLLFLIPLLDEVGTSLRDWYYVDIRWPRFLGHYFTWYAFIVGFVYMSLKRNEEIKRLPSVFDFKRFSLSNGEIDYRFYTLPLGAFPIDSRTISIWLEPGFVLIIGFVLWVCGQHLGTLLMVCSIIYSISYSAQFYQGDQFVMDKIDEMICNEELVGAFVEGRKPDQTRGFNFYGRRPADPETRRRVADTFIEDDEDIVVAL
jgi:cell division protein FtsW (lipid II flippase)